MKLHLFDTDEFCTTLKPVTSVKIYSKKGFHPDGLFSEKIFGPVRTGTCGCGQYYGRSKFGETCNQCGVEITHSSIRRKRFAKIKLPFPIINPMMFYLVAKVGKKTFETIMLDLINNELVTYYYDLTKNKYIKVAQDPENPGEVSYPEGVEVFSGHNGIFEIVKKEALKNKDSNPGWKFIHDNIGKFYMNNVIIPPPEFRPVSKSRDVQMRDEINMFYMTILNFTLTMHIEDFDSATHDEIMSINFKNLQKHVFTLYEYIFEKFSKKEGLIRGFILGKRIDFSGRAVIAPDPTLNLDECSVPYCMILELFKLDIINILLEKRMFKRYDPALNYVDECIKLQDYSLLDVAKKVTESRYVMLNRQPTLHRLGMLAFKVKINSDYVIKIHPLVCEPFNADFDGDQMAVYISLYPVTIKECEEKLGILSNLISPSTGNLSIGANQDIVLGLYFLTKEGSTPEVEFEGIKTTEGRVKFNKIFPPGFAFINTTITKKTLAAVLNIVAKNYPKEVVMHVLDKVKEIGFKETTIRGCTMSLKNMRFDEAREIVSSICDDKTKSINEKHFELQSPEVMNKIRQAFPYSDFIESGSRGSWDQAKQLIFCRGFISNSAGKVVPIPIKSNLIDGLSKSEFFISCYGSRKALLDTALNTGVSGYLTRKLVYCSVNLELDDNLDDCGTSETFNFQIPETSDGYEIKLARSIIGRYNVVHKNGRDVSELITDDNYKSFVGKQVRLRSPIFCKSFKLCKKCYGATTKNLHSIYAGIIAAQSLGEVATQLTLRTFHVGGIAQMTKGKEDNQQDIISDLTLVKKMLHGHSSKPFDELILDLFKVYVNHRLLLLVHFECIVSQMMRSGSQRWRVSDKRSLDSYEIVSIENVPAKESFLLALAFNKPYAYIIGGILGESNSTDGILENIMTNNI